MPISDPVKAMQEHFDWVAENDARARVAIGKSAGISHIMHSKPCYVQRVLTLGANGGWMVDLTDTLLTGHAQEMTVKRFGATFAYISRPVAIENSAPGHYQKSERLLTGTLFSDGSKNNIGTRRHP